MPSKPQNGLAFLLNKNFWKLVAVAVPMLLGAGGFILQLQLLRESHQALTVKVDNWVALSAEAHVHIMQRLAHTSAGEPQGPLRPLTPNEMRLIGLLQDRADGRP